MHTNYSDIPKSMVDREWSERLGWDYKDAKVWFVGEVHYFSRSAIILIKKHRLDGSNNRKLLTHSSEVKESRRGLPQGLSPWLTAGCLLAVLVWPLLWACEHLCYLSSHEDTSLIRSPHLGHLLILISSLKALFPNKVMLVISSST